MCVLSYMVFGGDVHEVLVDGDDADMDADMGAVPTTLGTGECRAGALPNWCICCCIIKFAMKLRLAFVSWALDLASRPTTSATWSCRYLFMPPQSFCSLWGSESPNMTFS